jgi:hypothetical protein
MLKVLFMCGVSYDAEYCFKPLQIRLKIDAGGLGGIRFLHVKWFDSLSFKDFLISPIIFVYNLGAGPEGLGRKTFKI